MWPDEDRGDRLHGGKETRSEVPDILHSCSQSALRFYCILYPVYSLMLVFLLSIELNQLWALAHLESHR